MTPDGSFPVYNAAANKYVGSAPQDHGGDLTRTIDLFKPDGVTPVLNEELPLLRALGGEDTPEAEIIVRNGFSGEEYWGHVKGSPICDSGGAIIAGMVIFHDISPLRAPGRVDPRPALRSRRA